MTTTLFTGRPARNIGYGVVQAFTEDVAYNTPAVGTADTIVLGKLPSGAQIVACIVRVTTAFNAATTNVLTVGTSSGSNADVVAAGDINEGVAGTAFVTRGCDLTLSSDTTIYIKFTESGTAATAGAAVVTLLYVVPANDTSFT